MTGDKKTGGRTGDRDDRQLYRDVVLREPGHGASTRVNARK